MHGLGGLPILERGRERDRAVEGEREGEKKGGKQSGTLTERRGEIERMGKRV